MADKVMLTWFADPWPAQVVAYAREHPEHQAIEEATLAVRQIMLAIELQAMSTTLVPQEEWRKYCGRGQPPRWTSRPFAFRPINRAEYQGLSWWRQAAVRFSQLGHAEPQVVAAARLWFATCSPPLLPKLPVQLPAALTSAASWHQWVQRLQQAANLDEQGRHELGWQIRDRQEKLEAFCQGPRGRLAGVGGLSHGRIGSRSSRLR